MIYTKQELLEAVHDIIGYNDNPVPRMLTEVVENYFIEDYSKAKQESYEVCKVAFKELCEIGYIDYEDSEWDY